MTPVQGFELVLVLLAAVIALDLIARRLHMPPAAAQIIGGIALALIPGTPTITLDPDLALVLFLPPLLMADAYNTAWRDFRANLRIILQLAIGAVVFTTASVGVIAHLLIPSLPWAACFALGAIVSPPDAVAAGAVLERVRLPRRVVVLLEGESLLNDASGLVLYRVSVAAALTGTFNAWHAAGSFLLVASGGVALGIAAGYLGTLLVARLRDQTLAVASSFLVGWGGYIAADAIGLSGVLSTVACGLVVGWRQHVTFTAETRLAASGSWQLVTFVLQSLIFVLIGLSLRGMLDRPGGWAGLSALALPIAGIAGAVIAARFLWVIPGAYLTRALFPPLRRRDPYPPIGVLIVISWAGMRGVVSLAAALALPIAFPGRDIILAAAFAVILVTVLVQGATLAPLIRLLRVGRFEGPASPTMRLSEARARIARAQFAAIERISAQADGTHKHPRLMEQFGYRARASERFSQDEAQFLPHRHDHFAAMLAAIEAGRAELVGMHRRGEIHDSVLQTLERELDFEELGVRRFIDEGE